MPDTGSACSFHPGRPFLSHNLGAYGDYKDAYIWSCCSRYAESSVNSHGFDLPPAHSPGCVIRDQHTPTAAIHFCCSEEGRSIASQAAEVLKGIGFHTDISNIRSPSPAAIEQVACVVFVSTATDAQLVENWAERLSRGTEPRVIVCFLTSGSERSRIHKADPNDLVNAAIQGVRQRFAGALLPQFKVFLSYRRGESAIAAAVHRFAAQCWWDSAVLNPGVDWASEIVTAIEACRLFVLAVRDPLPSESYVWREIDLALKYQRPIAILAFGTGGEGVLEHCRSFVQDIKPAFVWADRPIASGPRDRLKLLCHSAAPPELLYFADLYNQLRVSRPLRSTAESRDTYDTPNAVKLFNFLGDYPESCRLIRFS